MFKWLLVFIVCSFAFSALRPWLSKLGVGSMPGDFRLRIRQTEVLIPLGSTLFFSLCFWVVGKLI